MNEHQTSDEIEYAAPLAEPSHVHIPRPSRRRSGLIADDGGFVVLEATTCCACGEN
jgi:hypothetical protein